eukprot:505151-Amphidinium_carterae.2
MAVHVQGPRLLSAMGFTQTLLISPWKEMHCSILMRAQAAKSQAHSSAKMLRAEVKTPCRAPTT